MLKIKPMNPDLSKPQAGDYVICDSTDTATTALVFRRVIPLQPNPQNVGVSVRISNNHETLVGFLKMFDLELGPEISTGVYLVKQLDSVKG